MSYTNVVYGKREKSSYPTKLITKLIDLYGGNELDNLVYLNEEFRVLDLGCGDLTFFNELKKFYPRSTHGCDSDFVIYSNDQGKDFRKDVKVDFNVKLPYVDDSFDLIICKSVIEHVSNTDNFLRQINRILKPGGIVIILTPAWEYNYKDFYNDYTHVRPFHRKGLQDALKINNFTNVDVSYFYHLPWLWDRPWLEPVAWFLSLFSSWKWKDKEETKHRVNIRFSQEIQLLGKGQKYL